MARLVIDPDARDGVGTRELRNEDIWDGTVRFDAETGTSQDLDDDVAEQFADRHDHISTERALGQDEVDDAPPLDDLDGVLDGTIDEVEDDLATGEYDQQLAELESRERNGDDRMGVFDAIADRREARGEEVYTDEEAEGDE